MRLVDGQLKIKKRFGILTSNIMCPSSLSKNEEIVCKYCDVESLVNEESVPSLNNKLIVVKHHDTKNNLWDDDANTSADCDPSEDVDTTNSVTLQLS